MTPDNPQDPQKASAAEGGRGDERSEAGVGEAAVPEEAKEAKEAVAAEAPEAQPEPKPKRTRAKKPKAEAEAEAAEETEEKPKPRRARAKKTDEPKAEEAPKEEPKAEKPKAAPARRRDRRRPVEPGVQVRAQAKYVRTSARKARLVCDHIRGKDVVEARAILAFTPRAAAKPWLKLLESAVANAEHNHELVGDDLKIVAVHADEGPTLKRYRPRAMGRATRIRKRTSHLTITLTPKES
jgi:ribosomal protein L22